MKVVRRIGRVILVCIILVLTLLISTSIAIQIPAVQTKVAKFALEKLNQSLNTRMFVDSVDIDFFGRIYLNDISIKDDHDLDFITSKQLQTTLSIWSIIANSQHINLKTVKLVNPDVKVITYKGDSVSNFIKFVNGFSSDKPKDPNRTFKLDGDFYLKNGKVSIVNQNSGNVWLKAQNLQLHVEDFRLVDDDIKAKLANFCFFAERNGEKYNVKNFTGLFHYSKKEIRIDNLNLRTDDSVLNGNLVLAYDQPSDMSDFNNKVTWDVFFDRGSIINFKEIRYFTPLFDKNSAASVYGKVDGTLNKLKFRDFEIYANDNYVGAKQLILTDMMNGSLKIKTNSGKIKTSYQAITRFLPSFVSTKIPDFINRFGNMNYNGDFVLSPEKININGYAITGLGDADINAELRNYKNPKSMFYAGTLDAKNIDLLQITEVKELGYISGKLKFNGLGTEIAKMNLALDGEVRYIDLLGKRYNNIAVDGDIKDNTFNGLFDIKDSNLNGQLVGNIDFSGKPFKFDFTSKLNSINLDFLGVTKDLNAIVKADVVGDFSLTNLNDFKGNIGVKDLYFHSKKDSIRLDEVIFSSAIEGNYKHMNFNIPNYMQIDLAGNYYVTEVIDVLNNSLVKIIPSFKTRKVSPGQKFDFDINIEQNLLGYIDKAIEVEPDTRVKGFVNSDLAELTANVDTPGVGYTGIKLYRTNFYLNTSDSARSVNAKIDSLSAGGITIRELISRSIPKNDTLLLDTEFKIGVKNPVEFDFHLYHTISENRENLIFGFLPSTIVIDQNNWNINPNNVINSNRIVVNPKIKSFMVQDLVMESENQHLDFSGVLYDKEQYNFDANFKELDLDKIIPQELIGKLKINGIANGNFNIVKTKQKLEPIIETTISNLALNDFLLGNLTLKGGYNVADKRFNFDTSLLRENIESLKINGDIINGNNGTEIDIYANLDDFRLDFLEGFLGSVFSNINGTMSGDVRLNGPLNLPNINGDLVTNNLGMKVKFLGVDYLFEGKNDLLLTKEGKGQGVILLDNAKVKDTTYNTKGLVNGAILFRNLSEWGLNLQFEADDLMVMNTTIKDNELFFGRVFAKGEVLMMGPVEQLGIYGDATIVGNSELTINTGSTTVEAENNLVRFVPDKSRENIGIKENNRLKGMMIDLNINAYPNSQVNLIFDAKTNDKASARGTAENLRFVMNNTGLSLTGIYNIQSGTYEFRQIPLIPKDFKVKRGSYVQFSGNPLDAVMNINAVYERTVSNVGNYLGIGFSQVYDSELSINISETLARPKINFELTLPNAGSDINSQLQSKFRSNKDEQMLQFSYILLTGKFGDTLDLSSGVTSTAADIGLSTIAGVLSSIIRGVDVDLEYVGGSTQSSTNDKVRYSLSYQINDRLRVRGAYGMALRNQFIENFDGNLDFSYDISKANNGSLVLNAFTKPTSFGIQQLTGSNTMLNQSYGGGIMYNTSFDNFKELVGKRKREQAAKAEFKARTVEVKPYHQDSLEKSNQNLKMDTILKDTFQFNSKKINENSRNKRRGLVRLK